MSNSNKNTPGQVLWPESLGNRLPPSSQQAALLWPVFQQLIKEEFLAEADLLPLFDSLYLPMSCWIAQRHTNKPLLLGINGAQGSGKSTLTKILKALLVKGFNKRVVTISIDDLYLCRSDRLQLAASVHPLLSTRGVPGTHDVLLAKTILSKLKSNVNETISVPVFNKAKDDRADEIHWQTIDEPVDIILRDVRKKFSYKSHY
jgi:D-glycerate 3-kinase